MLYISKSSPEINEFTYSFNFTDNQKELLNDYLENYFKQYKQPTLDFTVYLF